AQNEEHNIQAVLESVKFADEIIVVDGGSTDKTLELAKQSGVRVLQREFDYPASQKNWAIPQASNEWILLVDADERVTDELREEIIEILKNTPDEKDVVAYWIYRDNQFMGEKVRFSGWQGDKVIRLFRKSKCRYEDKMVHEEIIADGKVGFLKNRFYHNTYTTFDAHIAKLNRYATWQASDYDKKTGTLTAYHFVLKPFWRFFKHYVVKLGFLDGLVGLVVSYLAAYATFNRYVKLWLLRKGRK
ncbi:MAG TPA: glycosyltransferase family 2 protein, partial [Chitinophagales bacterium]